MSDIHPVCALGRRQTNAMSDDKSVHLSLRTSQIPMDHVETRILSQAEASFAFLMVKSRRRLRLNRTPHCSLP
jgi:hypothetical protein